MSRTTYNQRPYRCQVELDSGGSGLRAMGIVIIVFLTTAALAHVWLRSNEGQLNRRSQNLRYEYAESARELENLQMERERFRGGRYILTSIDRLQLGLRQPDYGQVRRISTREGGDRPEMRAAGMLAKN